MKRAVCVLLAGCWTSTAAPPVAPAPEPEPVVNLRPHPVRSPCEIAIDHVMDLMRDQLDKVADFADKLQSIREVSVESCNETHWSAELLRCFDDTVDSAALAQCQNMLTPDQTSDLMKRVTEVMTQQAQPTP